jgi:hypothetical protein
MQHSLPAKTTGGDFDDCLDDAELDVMLSPVIPTGQLLRSRALWEVRTGRVAPDAFQRTLRQMLSSAAVVLGALHIMHHWTVAAFRLCGKRVTVRVSDSALSLATREAAKAVLTEIGVQPNDIEFCDTGKQPRCSNECGVHAIVNAWREFYNMGPRPGGRVVSLAHLRAIFKELARSPDIVKKRAREIAHDHKNVVATLSDVDEAQQVVGAGPEASFFADAPRLKVLPPTQAQLRAIANEGNATSWHMCYLFAALGALDMARYGARRERTVRQLFEMQEVLGHDFMSQHDARETIELLVHQGLHEGAPVVTRGFPGRDAPMPPEGPVVVLLYDDEEFALPDGATTVAVFRHDCPSRSAQTRAGHYWLVQRGARAGTSIIVVLRFARGGHSKVARQLGLSDAALRERLETADRARREGRRRPRETQGEEAASMRNQGWSRLGR